MDWTTLMCSDRIRMATRNVSASDLRTEFEKDYQRIISSASFRRLQDKTQVFPLDKSDFIRTRLTHSLEVANFARSIGKMIGSRIISENKDGSFTEKMREDVSSVLECAGLLHDIGNPPFGHFGEDAIRDWFRKNLPLLEYKGRKVSDVLSPQQREDFYNFEGNTQALRVVTKLHFLVDEHGMNLTKALLATIMKYPVSSEQIGQDKDDITCKKMGYFAADADIFEDVQKSCGTCGRRHPLSFALEAADDITYRTADIEDAVKKAESMKK
ncbi:MAG: dNTP triphosphohydrolase [Lachnospiraceae bacterium]|nr:dNTP triphosphohydrolase [Lachnospiraceae bacterium]